LLKDFDIDQECFYAEIELEFAQELRSKNELKFKDIPKFNKIRRDLALLIDKNVNYRIFIRQRRRINLHSLKTSIYLMYMKGKSSGRQKSYAMSFELLNEEKTLEEKKLLK
jgi:phenylalanyl-tRNA synthetase beta chain